ncbi:Transposon Ty3-I Gag-Pol polyprotein [Senna tora]|uniref:Transposon Ty3-I Gag-Pol polyprotein n=1 Tax=Senna tora TaxID=362788 RepID=A0A834W5D0_9FABA|nr:Transposon Ty3-I Gag-Pol polyprotein [Senna tora]
MSQGDEGGVDQNLNLRAIQQQFECMKVVFNEIRGRLDRYDQRLEQLNHVPKEEDYHDLDLKQYSKSVEVYYKEMDIAMIRANFEEDQEPTTTRFICDLNKDIAIVVELQHYVEFEDLVHMAMKVEKQPKKGIDHFLNFKEGDYLIGRQNANLLQSNMKGHIDSQCPNKRTMIMMKNGRMETAQEGDNDYMPLLEEDSVVQHAVTE